MAHFKWGGHLKLEHQFISPFQVFVKSGNGIKKWGNWPKVWGNRSINCDFKSFLKADTDQKYEETDQKRRKPFNYKYWKTDTKYSTILNYKGNIYGHHRPVIAPSHVTTNHQPLHSLSWKIRAVGYGDWGLSPHPETNVNVTKNCFWSNFIRPKKA